MILDVKLNFQEHIKNLLTKVNKTIGLLQKLQNILPRGSLLTIFKSFLRPHLDYRDAIYDQSFNNTFHQKMESIQYNTALAITGAIRGSSREKLYQELGLEFSEVLLFGNSSFNNTKNISILNTTIEYIVSSKRFEVPLYAWLSYLPLYYFYSFFSFFKFSYFHCAISHYR